MVLLLSVSGAWDWGDVTLFTAGQQGPAQEASLADGPGCRSRMLGASGAGTAALRFTNYPLVH